MDSRLFFIVVEFFEINIFDIFFVQIQWLIFSLTTDLLFLTGFALKKGSKKTKTQVQDQSPKYKPK